MRCQRVHAKIRPDDNGPRQIFTVSSGFHNEVFIRAEPKGRTMRRDRPSRIYDPVTQCVCVSGKHECEWLSVSINKPTYDV